MIKYNVPKAMAERARDAASEMGAVHNSIMSGRGNLAGFIGEYVVQDLTGATLANTKNYDLITADGVLIDVKTKQTLFKPEADYEASVARTSIHQKCDAYFFVRVLKNLSWAYVVGFYSKTKYFEDATFLRKGDYDESNDFVVKADCYNLPHHRLLQWDEDGRKALSTFKAMEIS